MCGRRQKKRKTNHWWAKRAPESSRKVELKKRSAQFPNHTTREQDVGLATSATFVLPKARSGQQETRRKSRPFSRKGMSETTDSWKSEARAVRISTQAGGNGLHHSFFTCFAIQREFLLLHVNRELIHHLSHGQQRATSCSNSNLSRRRPEAWNVDEEFSSV